MMRRSVSLRFGARAITQFLYPDSQFRDLHSAVDFTDRRTTMNFSILLAFLIFAIGLVAAVPPGPPMPAPLAPEVTAD